MKAAVLKEYGEPLVIEDRERPEVSDEGVIVELDACGICRSDWHAWQGDFEWLGSKPPTDHILGHEPVGTTIETGADVETYREGDQVAIPFNLADGTCYYCRNGHSNMCDNRRSIGFRESVPGAFAEELHVPDADFNVVKLPAELSPVGVAGLGCRFMTAYHGLVHRADTRIGQWLTVHGCGGVGQSAIHIGDELGLNIIGVDINENALKKAKELGATEVVNASETDNVPERIQDITNGGSDISVDALGIAETCQNSVLCLDTLGQHIQLGLSTKKEAGMIELPTDLITGKEITFLGSQGMQPTRYPELIDMVERGRLSPQRLISDEVTLEDVSSTLKAMTNFETTGFSVITEF